MKDSVGQIKFSNFKYPVPIKQIRLIDYFAGIIMGEIIHDYSNIKEIKEMVKQSYIIAKMMVEESKKYEDNA